jgi:hypothetical protein
VKFAEKIEILLRNTSAVSSAQTSRYSISPMFVEKDSVTVNIDVVPDGVASVPPLTPVSA